jgi:hypothetical protein
MVQAPFFEGLFDTQRIPDGPVSREGACTSIKRVETNRRPSTPFDMERGSEGALCAPAFRSAAVAHPFRSAFKMKDPIFTQRGGARRGISNYTWPFERLSVYENELILLETKILKENIEKLCKHNGLFSTGLRIERKSNKELLVFWSFNFRALKNALEKAGYSVQE